MSKNRLGFLALLLAILAVGTILLAACARPGTPTASTGGSSGSSNGGSSSGNAGSTVHMGLTTFLQSSVSISKGSKLTLVDDVTVIHIIKNGTYANGTPKPLKEPGAPTVDLTFNNTGDSKDIGPFSTAGTFHIYCTIHANMALTITVK